jgi:small subunit ribosomal protein S17
MSENQSSEPKASGDVAERGTGTPDPRGSNGQSDRQTLTGRVVSDKMDKTVTVLVERTVMHDLYQRYVWRSKKFHAHDERNEAKVGDEVIIVSTRPLSATKRWRLQEIVKRGEGG